MMFLMTMALTGTAGSGQDRPARQVRLELNLADGSRLVGTPDSFCNVASGWGNPQSEASRSLAEGKGLKFDPQSGNKFRIDVRGTRIQVWVDGKQLADVRDEKMGASIGGQTLDHGGIGFQTPWECMIWIRNFSVSSL